jgi:ribose-phosphate pyrophosphokinase
MIGSIKLLTGTSNQNLAKEVSEYLNIPLSDASFRALATER